MLSVAQLLLNPSDLFQIARVLAHIVTKLDSRSTICGSNLDDDVEGFGFLTVRLVCEII